MLVRWQACCLVFASTGTVAANPCLFDEEQAPQLTHPEIHTTDDVVPRGGGIVVEVRSGDVPRFRFRQVNTLVDPEVHHIAPGLLVYEPPRTGTPELELVDEAGTTLREVHVRSASRVLPAPKVTKLIWEGETAAGARVWSEWEIDGQLGPDTATVTAHVDVPEDALALVVYRQDGKKLVGAAWGLVISNDQVYVVTKSCRTPRPFLQRGQRVRLGWLDRWGRPSELGRPIVIR